MRSEWEENKEGDAREINMYEKPEKILLLLFAGVWEKNKQKAISGKI